MMANTQNVFILEVHGETLVVMPQGDSSGFRYTDIHTETNAALDLIERKMIQNLIIDFGRVEIVGSIMISSIIKLARRIGNKQGKSAFCSTSPTMREVVQSMNLTRLWPCYETRQEALTAICEPGSDLG